MRRGGYWVWYGGLSKEYCRNLKEVAAFIKYVLDSEGGKIIGVTKAQ